MAVRFIMIGGFLGAGKTTTLARLARTYQERGHKVGLVTNDQANDLVDTNSLRAQGFRVQEVAGACSCSSPMRVASSSKRQQKQAPATSCTRKPCARSEFVSTRSFA